MMTPQHFYTLIQTEGTIPNLTFTVALNAGHPLYAGHFPQQPVVPGVLMMAMVKDVLEKQLNAKLQLRKAFHLKYLNVLIPHSNQQIMIVTQVEQSNAGSILAIGTIQHAQILYCKFKLEFMLV